MRAANLLDISLAFIEARCSECDGCLLWKLKIKDHQPVFTKNRVQYKVRRVLWALTRPNAPRRGWVVKTTCERDDCVAPDHLVQVKLNSHLIGTHQPISQRRRKAQAQRARGRMQPEAVAEVKAHTGPLREMADKHGISIAWAARIRAGEVWKDYDSPFAALMGAA